MAGPSSRMLALLSLLQVHREWTGDELAERLTMSPRTLRRDVDRLRELGYRIDSVRGPAGGYRLAAGSDLPPLLFDDDQAVAIALALAVAPASGADIAESAVRALATVRQVMPERLRHRVDLVGAVVGPTGPRVDPDVLVAVSEAVHRHEFLRFAYGEQDSPHRVEPHAVVARHGRWYLLAWDPEHDEWRTYRVDRMTPRMPTRLAFAPRAVPGGDAAAFVSARFKGAEREDVWPCRGSVLLAVRDAARVAPYLAEDAVLEPLDDDDDRRRLTLGSWSWDGLAGVVAALTVPFVVEGPDELRAAVRRSADRLERAAVR
ncbi:transcriptional regulator [Curtobacterium sp. MCSS17_008]|uniref:helix-turn-helix transcriptional regulator n=1 Tax=Curtobacterium sp. MCSS17_008 TaxID=2175647 RepID=UPI000DA79874|nr:WYL domain-containing protein [Curtobacterium sp. MCSS17_008]PZF57306.1 transcriptional regulator [Curtobacterium sp. MCSS17_008]